MPVVNVIDGDGPDDQTVELSPDPYDCKPLPLTGVPVCVSLTKVGDCFVVDATGVR